MIFLELNFNFATMPSYRSNGRGRKANGGNAKGGNSRPGGRKSTPDGGQSRSSSSRSPHTDASASIPATEEETRSLTIEEKTSLAEKKAERMLRGHISRLSADKIPDGCTQDDIFDCGMRTVCRKWVSMDNKGWKLPLYEVRLNSKQFKSHVEDALNDAIKSYQEINAARDRLIQREQEETQRWLDSLCPRSLPELPSRSQSTGQPTGPVLKLNRSEIPSWIPESESESDSEESLGDSLDTVEVATKTEILIAKHHQRQADMLKRGVKCLIPDRTGIAHQVTIKGNSLIFKSKYYPLNGDTPRAVLYRILERGC